MSTCWGVVVAAGRGERFGGDRSKALIELGGTALVVHAVRALRVGGCDGIVVAAPADLVDAVLALFPESVALVRESQMGGSAAASDAGAPASPSGGSPVIVVEGGSTRQASVTAALAAVPAEIGWVLVHDAARPLVPPAVVTAVRTALEDGAPAVIPVLAVVDTLKSVNAAGLVTGTPDRGGMRRAQTPQGFERALLVRALDESVRTGRDVTDDAAAVADLGVPVRTVPGDERGLKITTLADLLVAEAFLAAD